MYAMPGRLYVDDPEKSEYGRGFDGAPVQFPDPASANASGVVCIFQELSLMPDLSVADNICISSPPTWCGMIDGRAQRRRADALLSEIGCEDVNPLMRVRDLPLSRRQMVEIAKALGKNPRILILDEATSSVDTETEFRVRDALTRMVEGRTSIMIAHRLSTVQRANKIVVMHKGKVREIGSHQQLLANRGIYWKLYQLQYKDQELPISPVPQRERLGVGASADD